MDVSSRDIRGCRYSARYQKFYNRANILYFDGRLPPATIYTAPLLRITAHGQKEVETNESLWLDAGEYGIVGQDDNGGWIVIVDRSTGIYHSILTKQTILHECIHLDIHPYRGHGIKFKKEIRRIAALGAFDTLI